jgi:hypothetical protein
MPLSFESLPGLVREAMEEDGHLHVDAEDQKVGMLLPMDSYRQPDGDKGLPVWLKLSDDAELLVLYTPQLYNICDTPHPFAVCRCLLGIAWRVTGIRFELDESDGEVQASHSMWIKDGTLTAAQLRIAIELHQYAIDRYHPSIERAMRTGEVTFPNEPNPPSVLRLGPEGTEAAPATVNATEVLKTMVTSSRKAGLEKWTEAKPSDSIVSRW